MKAQTFTEIEQRASEIASKIVSEIGYAHLESAIKKVIERELMIQILVPVECRGELTSCYERQKRVLGGICTECALNGKCVFHQSGGAA